MLKLSWTTRGSDGGDAISSYNVEWDTKSGTSEVQRVRVSSTSSLSGSFKLSFEYAKTAAINFDATNADVQAALEAVSTVGTVVVSDRTVASTYSQWTITFSSNVGDLNLLAVDTTSLLPNDATQSVVQVTAGVVPVFDSGTIGINTLPLGKVSIVPVPEIQKIWIRTKAADLGGDFKVYSFIQILQINNTHTTTIHATTLVHFNHLYSINSTATIQSTTIHSTTLIHSNHLHR